MMKIYKIFSSFLSLSLGLLILGFLSCKQENYDNPTHEETQKTRLTATLEDETDLYTRTALDQNKSSILWTIGDKIKVFTNQEKIGTIFESTNDKPSKEADFEGLLDVSNISAENPIYTIYPYSDTSVFDGKNILTSLASEQVAEPDGFADHFLPALAVSYDLNLSFYQIATGIRFEILTEGVRKVIFRGNNGEPVSGTIKVSMNESGRPEVSEVVEGCQWVTLVPPDNSAFEVGRTYYLSLLPNEFKNGFTLTFLTDTKAARYICNNQVTFNRSIWKNGDNVEAEITYGERLPTNDLPIVEVNVQDNAPVQSKDIWLDCNIRIGEDYYDTIVSGGKIRGRGNATWEYFPKKPYRIKFSSKESPFGFPPNKDWVLLAEFNDKSFLRLPYMCEVSKAVGAQYTINYKHVNLYLNGEYQGLYLLTDQVKVGKNRVDVEDDGFLIEQDLYYSSEPLWFKTPSGLSFSFKYPDANDGEIVFGDDNYVFITNFFSELETALSNITNSPEVVASKIDYISFAKWYLIQELTGNWEPNRFYVLESRSAKLKMYPSWDPEWSMGLARNDNPDDKHGWYYPPELPDNEAVIWRTRQYYPWLFNDQAFINVLKSEWNMLKPHLNAVSERINEVEAEIKNAQKDNFKKWQILNKLYGPALLALGSWEAEVNYVKTFFVRRAAWMDNYIQNL